MRIIYFIKFEFYFLNFIFSMYKFKIIYRKYNTYLEYIPSVPNISEKNTSVYIIKFNEFKLL